MLSRLGPPLTVLLLAGPVLAGLLGTLAPAFGYLPVLGGTAPTLDHFLELAAQPGVWRAAWTSLSTGLAASAASLAVVMLFLAGWAGSRLFRNLQHLVSPLLSVPHAAAAFGLVFLIAPSGLLVRAVSPWLTGWERPPDLLIVNDAAGLSLVAGLVAKEIPFLLLIAMAAMTQVPVQRTRMLTASLGYGRIAGFLHGSWPPLYRQMRLACFAVVAFSTSVVDVAMILGPTRPPTLAVLLIGWMNDPDISMRFLASAGALLQLAVTGVALLVWLGLEWLGRRLRDALALHGSRLRRDALPATVGAGGMIAAAAATALGLVSLAAWSVAGSWSFPDLAPASFTLRTWQATLPALSGPLATTLVAGLVSTAVAILLAILCLVNEDRTGRPAGRHALAFVYLPLIVPQAAFLFGLQLMFLLTGTVARLPALVLAHLVFVLPYVFLSLSDQWRAFDRRFEQVAHGLGRSRLAVLWQVRLPMLLRPILTAAAVGFAVSVGLYLPTMLVGAGRLPTVTTEAVALASGGNRRAIGVWAFIQMALPFAGFAVATLVPALLFRRLRAMRA
jgi:putative thiamine transport system permease protein